MTTTKANEEEKNPAAGGIAGGLAQASGTGKHCISSIQILICIPIFLEHIWNIFGFNLSI